ncbi:conserved hypothetical secreted protein [Methylophaga frappieri]|jgi:hypothetical protein|uniref:Conserved hypothetical secreted protein n=1 Tax=Methylophaga frappieri (strain ATCC BAA-2434 / DSM 25690 / JAM7) TaxID=754477 RepID=I1YJT2_METFJ|nr:hypothetical protein [Methylophaga frappieri]AFJ03175.1 conserved hypothetical secreted protein [Methylophaga frappieri]
MHDFLKKSLLVGLFAIVTPASAQSVAVIKTMSGDVTVLRNGDIVKASLGDELFLYDQLSTSANSTVGLLFHDDTRIGAGPDSRFSIDAYQYDSDSHAGKADLGIQKGTMALVGGKLAMQDPQAVRIKTPTDILTVPCEQLSVNVDELRR